MNRIGIAFDGFMPAGDANKLAQAAEEAGARSFWFAEHMGYREAVVSCTAMALITKHSVVVPTAVSPYLWHPTPTAMSLATLAELVPGRVALAVGVGNPLFLKESGKELERPLKATQEFVDCLRALWKGEAVHHEGEFFTLAGARCAFQPPEPIPVYIAAIGPKMVDLSGKIGDGLAISAALSLPYIKLTLERMSAGAEAAGRRLGDIKTSAYILTCVSDDVDEARRIVREKLAFGFRNKFVKECLDYTGLNVDLDAIGKAISQRDISGASEFVPDEAIDLCAVTGSVLDCLSQLKNFSALGLDEIVIFAVGEEKHQSAALELIKTACESFNLLD